MSKYPNKSKECKHQYTIQGWLESKLTKPRGSLFVSAFVRYDVCAERSKRMAYGSKTDDELLSSLVLLLLLQLLSFDNPSFCILLD